MKIKSLLAVVLAIVILFALTACGGGVNVDELSENYDAFQVKFNELTDVIEANGWTKSDEVYYPVEEVAQTMTQYADAIENPDKYDQETVDQMAQNCIDLVAWVDEVMAIVSVPYEPAA